MKTIVMWGVILGSAIWVLIDAKRIGVQKGQIRGIANIGPVAWFIVCLGIWIVGFPMYLAKRGEYKRVNGKPGGSRVATIVGLCVIVAFLVFALVDVEVTIAEPPTAVEQSIGDTDPAPAE